MQAARGRPACFPAWSKRSDAVDHGGMGGDTDVEVAIALALVVFGTWRPGRVMLGAYLFGGITVAQLFAQSRGVAVSSHLLSMLPYFATVVVLVAISSNPIRIRLHTPASLGRLFEPMS